MLFMMWYDNSKDPLAKKIERAAAYYLSKYGKAANTIVVHPLDLEPCDLPGVTVHPSGQCLRHHLLVSEETVGS